MIHSKSKPLDSTGAAFVVVEHSPGQVISSEANRLAATCLLVLPQHAHVLQTNASGIRVLDTTKVFGCPFPPRPGEDGTDAASLLAGPQGIRGAGPGDPARNHGATGDRGRSGVNGFNACWLVQGGRCRKRWRWRRWQALLCVRASQRRLCAGQVRHRPVRFYRTPHGPALMHAHARSVARPHSCACTRTRRHERKRVT